MASLASLERPALLRFSQFRSDHNLSSEHHAEVVYGLILRIVDVPDVVNPFTAVGHVADCHRPAAS